MRPSAVAYSNRVRSVSMSWNRFWPTKETEMEGFWGYHAEWNLGSPGGWDYQRITQVIGKAVWTRVNQIRPTGIELDFDHPLLHPIDGFVQMLVAWHRRLS